MFCGAITHGCGFDFLALQGNMYFFMMTMLPSIVRCIAVMDVGPLVSILEILQ